jgi:hypothetical protein
VKSLKSTLPVSVFLTVIIGLLASGCRNDTSQAVRAVEEGSQISISVNGKEFTSYLFGEEHKYPFFYPVNGPVSGRSVTSWDQDPYPHHSSVYISLDHVVSKDVTRGNYWQPRHELETGQVYSRDPRIIENNGKRVVIRDELEWIVPATGTAHFNEIRTITVWAPSEKVRVMDFEFKFDVLEDLQINPTGHSFFSARVTPEIAVGCMNHGPDWAHLGTGTIVDSEGNRDEAGTREKFSDWAAYYGNNNGISEGLAIIQHPENDYYPAQWVSRDYGFISPSPFTFNKEPVKMKAGQELFFKYRLVVFSGDHQEADISHWHSDFVGR